MARDRHRGIATPTSFSCASRSCRRARTWGPRSRRSPRRCFSTSLATAPGPLREGKRARARRSRSSRAQRCRSRRGAGAASSRWSRAASACTSASVLARRPPDRRAPGLRPASGLFVPRGCHGSLLHPSRARIASEARRGGNGADGGTPGVTRLGVRKHNRMPGVENTIRADHPAACDTRRAHSQPRRAGRARHGTAPRPARSRASPVRAQQRVASIGGAADGDHGRQRPGWGLGTAFPRRRRGRECGQASAGRRRPLVRARAGAPRAGSQAREPDRHAHGRRGDDAPCDLQHRNDRER
jgi:hypothetical protein